MKLIKNSIRIVVLAAVIIGIFSFMKKETLNSEGFIAKSDIVIENGVMTPEALLAFGRLSDPQVSPDGEYILYGVSYTSVEDNRSCHNLYICKLDGSENQLITESGKSLNNARWSADGKRVIFLMGGQIWSAGVSKKAGVWKVSSLRKHSDVPAGIGEFKLSPDQQKVMYVSTV